MAKLKVTQVRGRAGKPEPQRRTLIALGLRRVRQSVVHEDRPEIRGMIAKVRHLVDVEEVR
ncbi:MAG TPA: 50S ribosomal protein L30 [Actinomycetota bacterium]